MPLENYLVYNNQTLDKNLISSYVKSVSKLISNNIGGTEYGPAASFRDITRAIIKDSKEIVSIAAPTKFKEIPVPIHVGIPTSLFNEMDPSLYDELSVTEKQGILRATKVNYETYR